MRRLIHLIVLALIAVTALGACADEDSPGDAPRPTATPTPFRGLPEGSSGGENSGAGVIAGDDPGLVWVVVYGSSTNPAVVRQVSAEDQQVTVQVAAEEGVPATMDFVPTSSAIILPEEVDLDEPISFALGDWGTVTLDSTEPGTEAWVEPKE